MDKLDIRNCYINKPITLIGCNVIITNCNTGEFFIYNASGNVQVTNNIITMPKNKPFNITQNTHFKIATDVKLNVSGFSLSSEKDNLKIESDDLKQFFNDLNTIEIYDSKGKPICTYIKI